MKTLNPSLFSRNHHHHQGNQAHNQAVSGLSGLTPDTLKFHTPLLPFAVQ